LKAYELANDHYTKCGELKRECNMSKIKYITSLYEAAKIYFQSRGIAWFNLEAIDRIVKFLAQTPDFTDSATVDNAKYSKD